MSGWVKLYRELFDKPIWEASTPEQKVILVTLLAMANHREKEWEWKGERYKAAPGQFVTSLPSIAKKAGKGISIQNVRTALKRFESYGFLTDEATNKNRLITIVNWGFYQCSDEQPTAELTGNQQAANRQLTANKNVRSKEVKDTSESDSLFEEWWSLYAKKEGRAKCIKKYKTLLKTHDHQSIMSGTRNYLDHRKALQERGEFCPNQKNPLTFLNGEHFLDEYDTPGKQQAQRYERFQLDLSAGEN